MRDFQRLALAVGLMAAALVGPGETRAAPYGTVLTFVADGLEWENTYHMHVDDEVRLVGSRLTGQVVLPEVPVNGTLGVSDIAAWWFSDGIRTLSSSNHDLLGPENDFVGYVFGFEDGELTTWSLAVSGHNWDYGGGLYDLGFSTRRYASSGWTAQAGITYVDGYGAHSLVRRANGDFPAATPRWTSTIGWEPPTTPTPLPGSLLLLGSGLLGLGGLRSRKKAKP